MNQHAIEAAQSFMCRTIDLPDYYLRSYCEEHRETFSTFCPAPVSLVEKLTPHLEAEIRAQIAAEIRAEGPCRRPVFWNGSDGYDLGMRAAARIAEG